MTIVRLCILSSFLCVLPLYGFFAGWSLTGKQQEESPEKRLTKTIVNIQKKLHTPHKQLLAQEGAWTIDPGLAEGAAIRNGQLFLSNNLYTALLSPNKSVQEAAEGALAHELVHIKYADDKKLEQDQINARKGCWLGLATGIPLAMRYARTPRMRAAGIASVLIAGPALADMYIANNMYQRELRADREATQAGYGKSLTHYLNTTPHNEEGLKLWGIFACYPSTAERMAEINRRLPIK